MKIKLYSLALFAALALNAMGATVDTNYPAGPALTTDTDWNLLKRIANSTYKTATNTTSLSVSNLTVPGLSTNGIVVAVPDGSGTNLLLMYSDTGGANNSAPLAIVPLLFDPLTQTLYKDRAERAVTNKAVIARRFTATNDVSTTLVADDVVFQGVELANTVQSGKGATITSITWVTHTNLLNQEIKLLITKAPITWPANSAQFDIAAGDATNICDTVSLGTNSLYGCHWLKGKSNVVFTLPINIGISSTGTSVHVYGVTPNAWTNTGNDEFVLYAIPD